MVQHGQLRFCTFEATQYTQAAKEYYASDDVWCAAEF
jgi:hypothetical protein